MGLIQYQKISTEDYNSLLTVDEDVLYAVNDSGDFSEASMEDTCSLYIGDKQVTPTIVQELGISLTSVMSQKATTDAINNFVLPYGECSTAGATAAKVVTTSEGTFTLKRGARVMVKFINTHTASSMTLNVNGTGAKGVYWNGVAVDTNKVFGYTAYEFVYDGTYYRITGIATYNNATTSAAGLMSSADKTKLDGMANRAGYEAYLQWGGGNLVDSYSPVDAAMIPILGANRFNCYPIDKVSIEYSRDAGVTWVDYGATDAEKEALFREFQNATIQVGGKNATPSINNMVRITINTAATLYAILKKFIFYVTNSSGASRDNVPYVTISGRTQQNYEDNVDTWTTFVEKQSLSGWSGWNVVNTSNIITYGNTKNTQYGQLRFTFGLRELNTSYIGLTVQKMSAYGQAYTAYKNLMMYNIPYQYNYNGGLNITSGGLNITSGDVKLANYSNGKIHGHSSSQAIGNYSTALGYSSRTQVPTGDSSLPYGYIVSVSPLSFTIVDDTLYGVSLAKNDSTTYTYNGIDYTVTNPNATNHASVFLVKDSDNTLLKGTSYPNNVCVIAKSYVTISPGRILAVKNIVDDVYEIIVNQQNTTLQSYTSALTLYMFKKNSSSNYSGNSSVASGNSSVASGNSSVASGNSSVASGNSSVASGNFSVASGNFSVASGIYSVASGYYSVASGASSVASGYYSVASGRGAKSSHEGSIVSAYYGLSGRNYQTVLGYYNEQNSSAALVIGWGSGESSRKNIFTVNTDGTTNIAGNLLPMTTNTKSLGSTSLKWANVYATTFNGNATSATKVNNTLTIKNGSTTDTYNGSAAKTIDITKLNDIGTLSDLQTSDKTSLVNAINEVNTKANQSSGGTINDSTISPFAGYLPSGVTVIENSTISTKGDVLYDKNNNRFVFRDKSGTFVQFYGGWSTLYFYNNTPGTSATCRTDKLFSYNDQHYMVINGSLQDISNIESVLKSYSDHNKIIAIEAANNIAANQANNTLTQAKNYADNVGSTTLTNANTYTDTTIAAKIQLVSALPSTPAAGVLYLIPDEE